MTKKIRETSDTNYHLPNHADEMQRFFLYLKRLNPATFANVTPEFISESLENFERDNEAFYESERARIATINKARTENAEMVQQENDARRMASIERINAAKERADAEQRALLNQQENLRALETAKQNGEISE